MHDQLVNHKGTNGARGALTRFGYVSGWWVADAIRNEYPGLPFQEMLHRAMRRASEQGLIFRLPDPDQGVGLIIPQSWQSRQQLLRSGPASQPVCWFMTGAASGLYSALSGRPFYAIERSCTAVGDSCCRRGSVD